MELTKACNGLCGRAAILKSSFRSGSEVVSAELQALRDLHAMSAAAHWHAPMLLAT